VLKPAGQEFEAALGLFSPPTNVPLAVGGPVVRRLEMFRTAFLALVVKRCLSLEERRGGLPEGEKARVLESSIERHTLLFRETEGKRAAERSLQQFGQWLELNAGHFSAAKYSKVYASDVFAAAGFPTAYASGRSCITPGKQLADFLAAKFGDTAEEATSQPRHWVGVSFSLDGMVAVPATAGGDDAAGEQLRAAAAEDGRDGENEETARDAGSGRGRPRGRPPGRGRKRGREEV
jgi:hypothetical protein